MDRHVCDCRRRRRARAKVSRRAPRRHAIKGTKLPVPDGDVADFAIVLAKEDKKHASMYIVDLNGEGVKRQVVPTLDPTRSHASIRFNDAPGGIARQGGQGLGPNAATVRSRRGAVFVRAGRRRAGGAQHGEAVRARTLRVRAPDRIVPGDQTQARRHVHRRTRSRIRTATTARGRSRPNADELPIAAATARVSATEAFHESAKENIQTHGGMGFTWEFDCHMYYRRAKLLSVNLGSLPRWKDRLISAVEASQSTAA